MNDSIDGKRLLEARTKARMRRGEIAAELGVHENTVKNWEGGKEIPAARFDAVSRLIARLEGRALLGDDRFFVVADGLRSLLATLEDTAIAPAEKARRAQAVFSVYLSLLNSGAIVRTDSSNGDQG